MKLVLFSPGLNIGGIERVFINYANLLSDRSHDVFYLTCHENGTFENLLSSKVKFCNLKTNDLKKSILPIIKFLRHVKPDYIITANSATLIILLSKWLSFSKVKIIASHHNYNNIDVQSYIDRKLIWHIYNQCHKVIAISDGIYELLTQHHVMDEKLVKINNPVDFARIKSMSTSFVPFPSSAFDYILFVGRLSKVKNLQLLIRSFHVLRTNKSLKLVIIGDGPEYCQLKRLCKELGIEDSVIFVGAVENPYPYIKQAKIIALSSESEAYPTVLLESLVLGKTIVSTPTKGAVEILKNGELGYLSDNFELNDYILTLEYALSHPLAAEFLLHKAIESYSPESIINQFEKIII